MPLSHAHDVRHMSLESCPALVLNADFRPLSYFPLSLWCWQDVIKAVYLDRVIVIEEYDRVVHGASTEIRLPSVISLKEYISPEPIPISPALTCSCVTASPVNIVVISPVVVGN